MKPKIVTIGVYGFDKVSFWLVSITLSAHIKKSLYE